MGKEVLASQFALQKCYKTNNDNAEDHISRLPDEILAIIFSALSMREAARTSILSRKWRYFWLFFARNLDFDGSDTLYEVKWDRKSLELERIRFIRWVNQVLRSHQGPSVDELKVCFDLGREEDIDSWIEFAIRKKIRKLELVFRPIDFSRDNYVFPLHPLKNFPTLSFLTTIRLAYIRVCDSVLEFLLSHSPSLEVMSVRCSRCLKSLNVSGPSLKLKHLEIIEYCNLENLEISAENLLSFKYTGKTISILLKHVPCLAEISYRGDFSYYVVQNFCGFSSHFRRIERLTLCLESTKAKFPLHIPELFNLKYLELMGSVYNLRSLLSCIFLLDAAPLLHKFTLKIGAEGSSCSALQERIARFGVKYGRQLENNATKKYNYLKVVEVVGFLGSTVVEFITCILENVVSLEKFILNPRSPNHGGLPYQYDRNFIMMQQIARENALKLAAKLPPGVNFNLVRLSPIFP